MRILVDECVDPRVKRLFADHQTATVHEKKWDTLDDGALLAFAQDQFDVLLTISFLNGFVVLDLILWYMNNHHTYVKLGNVLLELQTAVYCC